MSDLIHAVIVPVVLMLPTGEHFRAWAVLDTMERPLHVALSEDKARAYVEGMEED